MGRRQIGLLLARFDRRRVSRVEIFATVRSIQVTALVATAIAGHPGTGHGESYDSKKDPKFSPRSLNFSRSKIETPVCVINILFPVTHEPKMAL